METIKKEESKNKILVGDYVTNGHCEYLDLILGYVLEVNKDEKI